MASREQYLKMAEAYEKLGRTAEAAELRALAGSATPAAPPTPAATPEEAEQIRLAPPERPRVFTPSPVVDPGRGISVGAPPVPAAPQRPRQPSPAESLEAAGDMQDPVGPSHTAPMATELGPDDASAGYVPVGQRDSALDQYYRSLKEDFVLGTRSINEVEELTNYTMTPEERAALVRERADYESGGGGGMGVGAAKPRVQIIVPYGSEVADPAPPPGQEGALYDDAPPVFGRPVDEPVDAYNLRAQLNEMERTLIQKYIREANMDPDQARKEARAATEAVLLRRVNPEGMPTTRGEGGIGSVLPIVPFFRESRIDYREDPNTYIEPDGTRRPATTFEQGLETFARQTVGTPEMAARSRQARALQRQLAMEDIPGSMMYTDEYAEKVREEIINETAIYFKDILSSVEPGTGRAIETPLGAVIRQTGIVSTLVNEIAMSLPLFYDIDDEGNPVDKNQFAYKVNDFLNSSLETLGVSPENAKEITTGVAGGSIVPLGFPLPFQGINRKGGTIIDPTGMRAATPTETIFGNTVTSLAKGRFLGDELYSMPAYIEDLASGAFKSQDPGTGAKLQDVDQSMTGTAALFYPLIVGAGAEMVYGIGPVSAVGKVARVTGKAGKVASMAGAAQAAKAGMPTAEAVAKGAAVGFDWVHQPVEQSKKVKLIRASQDLLDDGDIQKPQLDMLMDRSEIKTVIAETASKEILVPYLISQAVALAPSATPPTVGELRLIAGDSTSGRELLRRMNILPSTADDVVFGQGNINRQALQSALLEHKLSVYRPAIEAIAANKQVPEAERAAKIYDLLKSPEIEPLSSKTPGERAAFYKQNPSLISSNQMLKDLHFLSADPNATGQLDGVIQALGLYNPKYLPISPDAPVLQMLNKFGEDLQRGMPRQGPVAESFSRRLGEEVFDVEPGGTGQVPNPILMREAAIGAGGRVVANTLENLVPEDLILVTDTLMVQRQKLTPEVIKRVGDNIESYQQRRGRRLFEAEDGGFVDDVPVMQYRWDIDEDDLIRLLGANAINRSPLRYGIRQALYPTVPGEEVRPLTEAEHHFLYDTLLSNAYRKALGEKGAVEALLGGTQTDRAAQPSVGLGLLTRAQEAVPGIRTGETMPAQSRPLSEAREPSFLSLLPQGNLVVKNVMGSAVRKASKKFPDLVSYEPYKTQLPSQTPFIADARLRKIKEAVAAIPDNFQREVRAEALANPNPEAAFDTVVARRLAAAQRQAEEALLRRVDELIGQGMSEEEAWSTVVYQQRATIAAGGLGTQLRGGIIYLAKEQAIEQAAEQVKVQAWQATLNSFFGPLYSKLIAPDPTALRPYIEDLSAPSKFDPKSNLTLGLTLGNFRDVLVKIRKDNPALKLRGLQRPSVPYGEAFAAILGDRSAGKIRLMNDAVFENLAAWSMGMDRQRIVAKEATSMMDLNPWMRVDLNPSYFNDDSRRMSNVVNGVTNARVQALQAVSEAVARKTSPQDLAAEGVAATNVLIDQAVFRSKQRNFMGGLARVPGSPFDTVADSADKYSKMLDGLTVRTWRNMTPGVKADLTKYIYAKMMQEGRLTPDLRTTLYDSLDDPQLNMLFFEKLATTREILRIVEGLYASMSKRGAPPLGYADFDLFKQISAAEKAGLDRAEIVGAIRQGLLRNAIQTFVEPAIEGMQNNARAHGWTPELEATRKALPLIVDQINLEDPRFAMAGQDYIDAIANLQASSKDGKLAENLENLQRSELLQRAISKEDAGGFERSKYVLAVLSDTLSTPRSIAASGLLGGGYYIYSDEDLTGGYPVGVIPLPNTRYIGTNLLTAPLIALTTLGTTGAIRYLRPAGGAAGQATQVGLQAAAQVPEFLKRPLVNSIGRNPNSVEEVLFTTKSGRDVTRGELDGLMRQHNISLTRGGLEFANAFARDLARDARLTAEGVKAPALRQYLLRNMDPTRTGFWQYAANATDRMFRQNVFATAIKEGLPADQAAQLARNVVLDYGNVKYTGGLNKYVMFLAFREAMTRETIEAVSRDPDTINRTILLHRDLQKQMDDELNADHTKFRLPIGVANIFDNTSSSRLYGPINPSLSMYGDLVNFAAMGLQIGAKDIPTGSIARAVADESLTPIVDVVMADALARPTSTGKGQKVDDIWVAYAIQNSPNVLWPWLKETYNIVAVDDTEERKAGRLEAVDPQMPGLGRTEYRFLTPQDHARFISDMAKLQVLGFQRTMEDYTKMGLTYGVEDYIDPKRRGMPSTFGFALGLETPLTSGDQQKVLQKALREQEADVRGRTPRE